MNEHDRLNFTDIRPYVEGNLGNEPWLTVYERRNRDGEEVSYFCALAPLDQVPNSLTERSWDLRMGDGTPGSMFAGDERTYLRFGNEGGIEPLVFVNFFPSRRPSYLEVSEEFRHFHNLYEDRRTGRFIAFDDNGDEVEVIRMSPEKIEIRAKYLRDYLAAREMTLLIFFEFERHSTQTLNDLGVQSSDEERISNNYGYHWYIDTWPGGSTEKRLAFSRLIGKKVVCGTPDYDPSFGAGWRSRKYEEFVIEVDEHGEDVAYTCDEDKLANYFGKNPDAPNYLTPVFFRKEVLGKYYNNPTEYTVEDGHVSRAGNWSLRIDNNHADYVVVYLGDLSHLAHKEQLYWKSYNVVPDGTVSDVTYRRSILGEWTDADEPALKFKAAYRQFQEKWRFKFGWDLFKPLRLEDEHTFTALHVPPGDNQKEFDDQVLALAKVFVDRINEAEIAKHITLDKDDKGITKLSKYLDSLNLAERADVVTFLRNLYGLPTGSAHSKGKDYTRAAKYFEVEVNGFAATVANLLRQATTILEQLDSITSLVDDTTEEAVTEGSEA